MIYYDNSIGWLLKRWAKGLAITCIVLCIIGIIASLIAFFVFTAEYNEVRRYSQEALLAKEAANGCLVFIPVLLIASVLTPAFFAGMYALGVIVENVQAGTAARKKMLELTEQSLTPQAASNSAVQAEEKKQE